MTSAVRTPSLYQHDMLVPLVLLVRIGPDRTRGGGMTAGTGEDRSHRSVADAAADDFRRWRAGAPDALEQLVRRLTPTLWHIARAYGLSAEAAEDVIQSSWLALARTADSIRDPQAIVGWLYVTTRREAARAIKETRREDIAEPAALSELGAAGPALEDAVLTDYETRTLWRRVSELSERCRQLLRVVAFEDRPDYRSISAELGMPVGSIGPTRRRCLDKLRELLAQDAEWSGR